MTANPRARTTEVRRHIQAPRAAVYAACLDPVALVTWRVPGNMTARVETFDARPGGRYRMSLTYRDPAESGKTEGATDTFEATFAELVPNERIVELIQFESPDPSYSGEMRMITSLRDHGDGTEVTVRCENLPTGVRLEDNEEGTRQALEGLAAYLERG